MMTILSQQYLTLVIFPMYKEIEKNMNVENQNAVEER